MHKEKEVHFMLNRWSQMLEDQGGNDLSRKRLKMLYQGLSEVSKEDRLLLAEKYMTRTGKPHVDAIIAINKGVTSNQYRRVRKAAETRLAKKMQPILDANRETLCEFSKWL
jgi:hypothetical protein